MGRRPVTRRGDRARRHRPRRRRRRPAGRARPGGLRPAARGHGPVRGKSPRRRHPGRCSGPGPTWWSWPWSTTTRSWPCSTGTTGRSSGLAPGSDRRGPEHGGAGAPSRRPPRLARRRDVDVLDCGVSGGPQASADGTLVAMVGGDAAVDRAGPPRPRRLHLAGGAHGPARRRAQGQAGPQPRAVRVVAGRLRGPGAGRGGRDRAGQAGRGDQGQRQVDRRCLDGSCSATPSPRSPPDDRSRVSSSAMAAGAGLAHKDLRAALELGRTPRRRPAAGAR